MALKDPSRRRFLRHSGVAVATLGGGLAATSSASASTGNQQGILANGLAVEGGDRRAFISGLFDGMWTLGKTTDAETLTDRMRNEFQANTDAWIRYGNWLLDEYDAEPAGSVTVGVDVIVTRWIDDDETVPTTVRAEFDNGAREFADLEWVNGAPDEPDYELPIRNNAAEFAADDLQSFRREFIGRKESDHALPGAKYVSRLAGKYIAATRLDDETAHALGVLVGDLDGT